MARNLRRKNNSGTLRLAVIATGSMKLGKNHWDPGCGIDKGIKESPEAYRCFKVFLELGRNRTLKQTAAVAGKGTNQVEHFSKKNNWRERAAYYDASIVERWNLETKKEFESQHKKALKKFREDQQRRAEALGNVADLLIDVTTESIDEMRSSGDVIDRQQLAAVARTAAALADAALNVGAASLGVDDLLEAISPDEASE